MCFIHLFWVAMYMCKDGPICDTSNLFVDFVVCSVLEIKCELVYQNSITKCFYCLSFSLPAQYFEVKHAI